MSNATVKPPPPRPLPGEPRGTWKQEGGIEWVAKVAKRRIRGSPKITNVSRALGTLDALNEAASDATPPGPVFKAAKGYLAGLAGITPRWLTYGLYELQEIGVIKIKNIKIPGKKENDINEYTLLTMCNIPKVKKGTTGSERNSLPVVNTNHDGSCSTDPRPKSTESEIPLSVREREVIEEIKKADAAPASADLPCAEGAGSRGATQIGRGRRKATFNI